MADENGWVTHSERNDYIYKQKQLAATFQTAVVSWFFFVVAILFADWHFSPELNMREKFERVFQESLVITFFPPLCRRERLSGGNHRVSRGKLRGHTVYFWRLLESKASLTGVFLLVLKVRPKYFTFKISQIKAFSRTLTALYCRPLAMLLCGRWIFIDQITCGHSVLQSQCFLLELILLG